MDFGSIHQDGAFDQVGMLRHEGEGLFAGGRIGFHAALAIQLIAGIQKQAVVAFAD